MVRPTVFIKFPSLKRGSIKISNFVNAPAWLPALSPVTNDECVYILGCLWKWGGLHLSLILFSLYDLFMVTEEQIQKWVDEAEAGYDVQELKRRGRGRPGRGAEPMQVIAVRLTAEEIAALDEVAGREHLSRSEAIRRALAQFAA